MQRAPPRYWRDVSLRDGAAEVPEHENLHISIYLSIYISIYLYLSISIYIYLSIYLSVYVHISQRRASRAKVRDETDNLSEFK